MKLALCTSTMGPVESLCVTATHLSAPGLVLVWCPVPSYPRVWPPPKVCSHPVETSCRGTGDVR